MGVLLSYGPQYNPQVLIVDLQAIIATTHYMLL